MIEEAQEEKRSEGVVSHRQLGKFLHGLAAGEAVVEGGAACDEHDAAAAADGGYAVHQAPQRDALLVVGVPRGVHCLCRMHATISARLANPQSAPTRFLAVFTEHQLFDGATIATALSDDNDVICVCPSSELHVMDAVKT